MKQNVHKSFMLLRRPLLIALCSLGVTGIYANPGEGLAASESTHAASQAAGNTVKPSAAADKTKPDRASSVSSDQSAPEPANPTPSGRGQPNATQPASAVAAQPASATTADDATATQVTDDGTTVDDGTKPLDTSYDPSENFNRAMFTFNENVDAYFMKPVATVYNSIMPKPLNQGIHNFFNNIGELPTIANDLLQVNLYQMTNDLWRFTINTTVGIGGLFDVATRINLPYYQNDFGLTMATYGYDESSYLVLPFWGPRTWRDAISLPVDFYAFSLYPYINPDMFRYQVYALNVVDTRANLLQYQNLVDEAAIDKYVFMRDAYMQSRAAKIKENQHLGYDERDGQTVD